jgi:hypothetical protein
MSWELTVETGNAGGAPPHRVWRASQTWRVPVNDNETVEQLIKKIKLLSGRQDLTIASFFNRGEGEWKPSPALRDQTINDAGLRPGSILAFSNGMMD